VANRLWNKDFTLLTASNFLMCCTYYSLVSTLPVYIANELHATESTVGLLLASYTVAAVIIRPITGFGLDRLGRKSIFVTSLVVYAFIFCGYLVAFTVFIMFVVRFFHGLTWGLTTTSNSTVAVDLVPAGRRGQGIGYFGLSTTMGMALGPVIGALIAHAWGYPGIFITGLAVSLVSAVLAAMIRYPAHEFHGENVELKWSNLLEGTTIIPALNIMLIITTYGGLMSFIALYGHQIGISNPSGFFLIYAVGVAMARFTSGKMMDRKGPRQILIVCLTMLILGFPLLAIVRNPVGFYLSAIVLGAGNGVIWPTFQTMANNLAAPRRRGVANSTLFGALDIGMGLGMVIVGVIAQHTSISTAFLVCSGISLAGLLLFLTVTHGYYWKNLP
jgi:MFS family permease